MKYYVKKKIALILAAAMATSQTSFIFAAQTSDFPKEEETINQLSDDSTDTKNDDTTIDTNKQNTNSNDNKKDDATDNADSKKDNATDSNDNKKDDTTNINDSKKDDATDSNDNKKDDTTNINDSKKNDATDNTDSKITENDNIEEKQKSADGEIGDVDFSNIKSSDVYTFNTDSITAVGKGDQFCISKTEADSSGNGFTYSAHVKFNDNNNGAASLAFGGQETNDMYIANINRQEKNFCLFKFEPNAFVKDIIPSANFNTKDIAEKQEYDIKVKCVKNKLSYFIDDTLVGEETIEENINGKLGLLTWASDSDISVTYSGLTVIQHQEESVKSVDTTAFKTNLDIPSTLPAAYEIVSEEGKEGLHATAKGDQFFITDTVSDDFVYSTDITFNNDNPDSAAALVFRKKVAAEDNNYMYVANLSPSGKFRLFKFEPDTGSNIAHEGNIADLGIEKKDTYTLKVVCVGRKISYYIDDVLVTSTGDYFAPNYPNLFAGFGQKDIILEGKLGFLTWGAGENGADVTYQNVYYGEITAQDIPQLTDLQISGEVEYENNFKPTQYNYQQYVSNETDSVSITAEADSGIEVTISTTEDGEEITGSAPLEVGQNFFTVEAKTTVGAKGVADVELTAPIAYRLSVFRRYPESSYYNEDFRGQYHYSVKDGWANDPNGLIKAPDGTYHMFYQFFPSGTKWGPMHWMHATSKDLITWKEQPVAFYPNEYGAMYSGCAVYDTKNTSGLVPNGGFIAMITAHSEHDSGQGMILAYSEDGNNWEFYEGDKDGDSIDDGIILSWTDGKISSDNGHSRAFRDPKIFRYDNKWFMVIAGGILRIYSSDNLIDWKLESNYTFPDRANDTEEIKEYYAGFQVETECPDLYRLPNPDGGFKWVLSYGGRFYRIGDFEQINGHYQFVPDEEYKGAEERDHNLENVGIMNFGPDSYAAMTYYEDPSFNFNEEAKNPDVIAFNWMNTWDNYCNDVSNVKNDNFNGTFNLNLKLSLAKDAAGKLVLQQTPVETYEKIINAANNTFNGTIEEGSENPFAAFAGDSYLIEATFTPEAGTTDVGFHVRTGTNGEKTTINYNVADKKVTIDRSHSGKSPTEKFKEVAGQVINETPNPDGSITLHIYVDRSSVEVFSRDYTVTGAMQIFPMPASKGLEVYAKGGKSKANIEVKEINSIWTDKVDDPEPQSVQIDKTEARLQVEQTLDLNAWLSNNPMLRTANAEQDIEWKIDNSNLAELEVDENNIAHVTAKAVGDVIVTATATENSELSATCKIHIVEDKVNTNLTWNPDNISWYPNGTFYFGKNNSNSFMFATERSSKKDYTYELDIKKGFGKIVNVVFESQNTNAFDGCYALQLNGDKLRLFDFKNDKTFKEEFTIQESPDEMYHVQIVVKDNTIKATVNDTSTLEYTVTEADRQYSNGLFGVALYETEAEFSNLFVTYNNSNDDNNDDNNNNNDNQNKTNLKDIIAKISAENYVVNGKDANTQESVKNWVEQKVKALPLDGATVKNISITDFVAADEKKEGSFSFTVTIAKGTETASSGKLSGTITKIGSTAAEELQKVIDVISTKSYVVSGKTANTKSKVEDWLKNKIKDIDITEFTIDSINIESFTAAKSKTDGNFVCTVTLSKGEGESKVTLTSKYIVGEITQIGESSSSSSGGGGKTGSSSSYRGQSNAAESKDNKNDKNDTNNATNATISTNTPSSNTNTSVNKFVDVSSHWAVDSIQFVVEKGYFAGTSENNFSPDVAMTRAMVVSVLGRVANAQGSPTTKFVDVDTSQYYAPFIGWALQNGIASGVSETEFSPNANVTREQLAVMFANFMKQQGFTLNTTREANFTDSDKISPWAKESVEFMVKSGILNGRTDGSFDPKGIATRAEVATVLKLFLEKTNK